MLAAACAANPTATAINFGSGVRFVPVVADSLDNVGLGSAVALDAAGLPYVTYFGFPAVVKKGEIPIPRPIGSPFLPGVLLSTVDANGVWTHGAIEQTKPKVLPQGVTVPFGPVTTENLQLTADDSNGTAVALGSDGTVHAAWTMRDGVYYGTTKAGGTSTVEQVFNYGTAVALAGPISAPGIALDPAGNPWVAFSVPGSGGLEVHAATLNGSKWTDQVVATAGPCNGCAQPGPTGIAILRGNPVVVFGDAAKDSVETATRQGSKWVVNVVETKAQGLGLSVSTTGNTAYASYYTGHGTVRVALLDDHAPTTMEVAKAPNPSLSKTGNSASRTAVAAGKDGTIYVAWDDETQGLQFWKKGTDAFTQVDTGTAVAGGQHPALAASDSGVYLSWYDTVNQNLMVGAESDVQNILVANPPPSVVPSFGASSSASCGQDKKIQLDISATGTSFDTTCLVGPASKGFTISFDNQATGIQHNIDVFDKQGGTSLASTQVATGPAKQTLPVQALDAGKYYFQCDVHPTLMFGNVVVVKGAS
jgi:plastocyanin